VDGPNRYSYVRNNPLSAIDPTGHAAESVGFRGPALVLLDREAHKITFDAGVIEFSGPGVSQEYVDWAVAGIRGGWGGATTFEGQPYQVNVIVSGKIVPVLEDAPNGPRYPIKDNVLRVWVTNKRARSDAGDFYGRAWGHYSARDRRKLLPPHEFGHVMGLPDAYKEVFAKWVPLPNALGPGHGEVMGSHPHATPRDFQKLLTGIGLEPVARPVMTMEGLRIEPLPPTPPNPGWTSAPDVPARHD
jgi:hypothetical protein